MTYAMHDLYNSLPSGGAFGSIGSNNNGVDESLGVPSFSRLNPYSKMGTSASRGDRRWQPVPGLNHSKESLHFRRGVGTILKKVHEEISPAELEVRANTPEFKVHEDDWVAHKANKLTFMPTLKTVARIPASLIIPNEMSPRMTHENDVTGYLRKRGEHNRSYKRRYMELNGSILSYYKKKPEKNGIPLNQEDKKSYERGRIDLDRVSSLQPIDLKVEPFGIHLVTTNRTWAIAAESEQDYQRWLKSLTAVVKFSAVHATFKRMLLLQEVSSKAVTDVRMVIPTMDTVGEIVEHIFNCYKMKLDAAPLKPYDPTQYVLKVTGSRDYMIDRYCVMNEYMHVREMLLTKGTLRLTVISKAVIQESAMRSLSIRSDLPYGSSNQLLDYREGDRNSLQMTTLGDDWERASNSVSTAIPSGEIHEPYAIRINRVMNIPRFTCVRKRSSEEASIEQRLLTASNVVVRIELFDNGQLLERAQFETPDVRLKAQRNNLLYAEWEDPIWHQFNVDVCDIVRSMRIQLTLVGVKRVVGSKEVDGVEEKILVTGVNAFEVDGVLTQGTKYFVMLNNLNSFEYGPIPHIVNPSDSLIHVDFPRYPSPIKFGWSQSDRASPVAMSRMARRSIVGSAKSSMVRKVGWLQKLGFSRWTKWRMRWFEVDQESCTLSYADNENAPKKYIPLKMCSIMVADEMNEKYTTCPVNKGTRKERNTWCFKLRPHNATRVYIISADTKQEREEWMLAIHAVSKGESTDNNDSFLRDSEVRQYDPSSDFFDEMDNNADEMDGRNILENFAQERRDSMARTSDTSVSLKDTTIAELRRVILMDPLYRLGPYQKSQMWAHREEFINIPAALPRILSCVDWIDREEVEEALELLPRWAIPDHPAAYIELLNGEFANEAVRSFAVSKIALMRDTTFSYFLPQLVQALKFENHILSPLALLLIERAIKNPNQIGFDLFWSMKVESYNPRYRELYGTILNTYLDVCSHKMRAILKLQDTLFSADGKVDQICQTVKSKKKEGSDEMKRVMREGLNALNEILPSSFQLPIDPRIEVGKIIVSKCRVMDSAKKPLWLVFENAEESGEPVTVMFKAGDDVRQDCLTLQLIRLMDEMWRDEGLDLAMEPYRCVATSPMTGILEIVKNSVTTADVHKRVGILGAFRDPSFSEWINANNPDPRSHKTAVELFSRSCAGYCVATCVLGIGDRHNDNIMICSSGRYFHIDFGHFLGHFKYQMGVRRERTPFVFTREMAHVFGGTETREFQRFVDTCCTAYNIVRKHMHLLVSLLLLMVPADMPELQGRDDINHLVTMLGPELTEEQARASFTDAIYFCLDNKFKRIDNTIHIFAHLLS